MVNTDKPAFNAKIATVCKQSGSADYAIAYITSIAFGLDPSLCVFNQTAMRDHLLKCLQAKKITPFPIMRERRSSQISSRHVCVKAYYYCRCTDTGEKMVLCDGQCGQWFHMKCIYSTVSKNRKWFCNRCEPLTIAETV